MAGLAAAGMATGLVAGCGSSGSRSSSPGGNPAGQSQLGAAYDTVTASSVTLNGAGANSIDPLFEKVFYDYHRANPKTTVNYSPAGSSVGAKDIEANTVDFDDSEIPLSSSDLAKATAGPILQIPVDLGGVAVSYNVPGVESGLKLDGPTLAGIFDGSITKWNDPRIAAVSGESHLPGLPIVAVHRADSSGPGWDLDAYLLKTAPDWVTKAGTAKPSKTWPLAEVGIGQQLNTGVANYVHQTPGAIGFVEYGYALKAGFTNVAVKNQTGSFVAPSLESIREAGSQASGLSPSNFSIIDEPGAGSYPLANFSWTLVYQKQSDQAKGQALGKLIDYVITTGQKQAPALGYAPLPANVVSQAEQTLVQLETSSGRPLFGS
ncbi:MAG TPA: phosphate ABC transporter substrate-binding protein PstS [Acidimicrobiales bacterium]|nr:phosphate ABC transporter substrate-binding protein PstS [Acidimicrobiales bacterium]